MDKQSVRVSVNELYFALISEDSESNLTYGTPDKIPGVTEITVSRNSSKQTHYSDGKPSETIPTDGDTALAINLDGLSSEMEAKYVGGEYDAATGLYEDGWNGDSPYFAVGYRAEKANKKHKYTWFYKGSFNKPDESNQTKSGGSVNVQQDKLVYTAVEPQYIVNPKANLKRSIHSDDANLPTGVTDETLNSADTNGWFSSPLFTPAAIS